ncbi:hypothetical protein Tco_0757776 [Tanacetum coccineum]
MEGQRDRTLRYLSPVVVQNLIADVAVYQEITLVDETQGRINDEEMFDTCVLNDEEVFARQDMAQKEINLAKKEVSTTDPVTTSGEVVTTTNV